MVVVKLAGGLGNQLFQYAAGRSLAQRWNTDLKLDLSFFSDQNLRAYSLSGLNTLQQFASAKDIAQFTGASGAFGRRWLRRVAETLKPPPRRTIVSERRYLHYDPELFAVARDIYLVGYWQNAKYFSAVDGLLRTEFSLSQKLLPASAALTRQIAHATSIGVHVRRGDYVTNARTRQIHGGCTADYYNACAQALIKQAPEAHFFVFSDDPAWARANLHLGGPTTVVEPSGADRDCEQLLLLSTCRHLILSNSTFSWWAVWLGQHEGQIVYAPKQWFADGPYDTSDFVPSTWLRQ